MSSTDSSSDEDAANIAVKRRPQMLHGKGRQKEEGKSRASTKYTTSSDEASSSDDEDNLLTLFSNLNMQQKEKLNELIGAIHEKDELLDSQEEFLIKENKKHVKVKNSYAQEVEKNENLTNDNASLIAKIDKLNESIASLKI
jgi:rubrerythrin